MAVDEIQSSKQIGKYYKLFDDEEIDLSKSEIQVKKTLDLIVEIYPQDDLRVTNFKRIQLFYSLFTAFYNLLYGVKNVKTKKSDGFKRKLPKVRIALDNFSALYDEEHESLREFIEASRRATTDQQKRIRRAEILCEVINKA